MPITDRKQLTIIPEYKINNQAANAYAKFKQKAKLIQKGPQLKEVKKIGKKIELSVSAFFEKKGKEDPTKGFRWDYVLVDDDKTINAWCMPGGKIAVFTGLLKVTKNTDGLSIVMGHEIAHAVAKHSVERASQAMTINIGSQVLIYFWEHKSIEQEEQLEIIQVLIVIRNFKSFWKKTRTEADYLGLIFSSLAGYDIKSQ